MEDLQVEINELTEFGEDVSKEEVLRNFKKWKLKYGVVERCFCAGLVGVLVDDVECVSTASELGEEQAF